jgi:hypothetical protein
MAKDNLDGFLLEPGERVILVVRKHWVNIGPILIGMGLLAAIVLTVGGQISRWSDDLTTVALAGTVTTAVLMVAVAISVLAYWVFSRNRIILTNRHLVQITQTSLFNRTVSELSLERVQDVSVRTAGLLPTLLHYGDILIETAGEQPNFTFKQLPHPHHLARTLMEAHAESEHGDGLAANETDRGQPA